MFTTVDSNDKKMKQTSYLDASSSLDQKESTLTEDQLSFAKKRDLKERSDELSYSKMTIEGKQKSFKDVQEQRKQLKGKRRRNLNEDINKG